MCFDFLYNLDRNISHSKKNSARYYHKCKCLREVPDILVGFQSNLNLFDTFSKNNPMPAFKKIAPLAVQLSHSPRADNTHSVHGACNNLYIPTNTRAQIVKSHNLPINFHPPTSFSDKSLSSRRRRYKAIYTVIPRLTSDPANKFFG